MLAAMFMLGLAACEPKPEDGTGGDETPAVEITAIELSTSSITLDVGQSQQVTAIVQPADADPSRVAWRSDNERVATVDASGKITGVGYGTTFIYAEADDQSEYVMVRVNEPERTYTLVWEDDFEGTALNESYWNYAPGAPQNNEKEYYKAENVSVKDGCLVITAKQEHTESNAGGAGWNYTSGRINTQGKQAITYGKIEARINFPTGAGTWCAFWLMPNESVYGVWPRSGEVDIVEHVGSNPNKVSSAVHTRARNGNVGTEGDAWNATRNYDNVADDFHVYGVEWVDNYRNGCDVMIFTFDGEEVGRCSQDAWMSSTWEDWPFDQDFYVILNMAIGGNFTGAEPIDNSIFPIEMKVDWVRMYQLQ